MRERESALSACLVCIYIFSEPALSALYPGFITDWVLSKDGKIPWMLSNLWPTTFCFLRPIFFALSIFFSSNSAHKRCRFGLRDGSAGKGRRQRKRQKNKPVQALDKIERENTKLLLLLTLKRPVSPLSLPSLSPPLASQPHLFTLTGLERGLASPAVSSFSFCALACPVSFPSLLTLKKTQKE